MFACTSTAFVLDFPEYISHIIIDRFAMPEKILVVDDDVDSLKLIGLMLQRHGYEVSAANTGGQALAKADSEGPDLIILDVMMPDMNGYDVCRQLRQNPKTQSTPIIMFTAKTLIDDKVAGFEAGADDYLTKPTHPAELASRVRAILARNDTPKAATGQGRQKALTIGVIGSKGGVGTTTIALNLAGRITQSNESVIVADFRFGVGSMGLFLGLGRTQTMSKYFNQPDLINNQNIQQDLAEHQSGIKALLSSARPNETQIAYDSEAGNKIIDTLSSLAQHVILDLGHGYNSFVHAIQGRLDKLILVVEPNNVSLSIAREMLQAINENTNTNINVVIVNRAQSNLQTPWHEVEQILGQEIKAIISPAPELAFQSIENTMPMLLLQPNAIVSSQLQKLADDIKSRIKSLST